MNIFEGSRRIAKIVAALWSTGCVIYAVNNHPSVSAVYEISIFDSKPKLAEKCPADAVREYLYSWQQSTPSGTGISLTLCFLAADGITGTNSQKLIPYKIEPTTNKVWANEKYSTEVTTYAKKVADNFKLPEADFAKFDAEARTVWWEDFFTIMGVMIGGLAFLFGFTWAVGYVVRGFMGIPNKSDTRSNQ
jgi:hypothetical protein